MKFEFPKLRMVALVTRAERIESEPYGRTSFEFDAIDAETSIEALDEALTNPEVRKPFAAVRVVTTEQRYFELNGFVPSEGMWVELELTPYPDQRLPLAFYSPLEAEGYDRYSVGRLGNSRLLLGTDEPDISPAPLGASVAPTLKLAHSIKSKCAFPAGSISTPSQISFELRDLIWADRMIVRDVGQASFVSFRSALMGDQDLAHFDAGWPISFNGRTAPSKMPALKNKAPVILSHWDWDHLHSYHKSAVIRDSPWITPVQNLGPGAFKIANALAREQLLFGCPASFRFGPIDLIACTGPHPMNDTGLALVINLRSGKRALLVGDANYAALGAPWISMPYDFLVVTHHGAHFHGPAPSANGDNCPAVVSVGKGNVYRHPRKQALRVHRAANWKLQRTSQYGTYKRGDRVLK